MPEKFLRVQCKERTKTFTVDRRIVNLSPLFADTFDDMNEQSEVVQLDFADEASFAKALEFCEKIDFTEGHSGRRLLGRQAVKEIEEVFTENKDKVE